MEQYGNNSVQIGSISGGTVNINHSISMPEPSNSWSKKRIWEANKRDYLASRSEGNRFANLNILSNLLPHGYIVHDRFIEYGRTENGDLLPLQEILNENATNNISIIGEGGIGKTTFLLN